MDTEMLIYFWMKCQKWDLYLFIEWEVFQSSMPGVRPGFGLINYRLCAIQNKNRRKK